MKICWKFENIVLINDNKFLSKFKILKENLLLILVKFKKIDI